ncbi:MAG: MATE family efflux transporter [Oscillospiraceae bacterium]|nr:MATE family efflux transporter [Oscillospiraceae bacterium]
MKNSIYQKQINFKNIIIFTIPTIFMIVIQQMFSMVDGVFVSNLIGTDALTALNLISPYFSVVYAISALFSSGGSAVVMKKMGEGNEKEAKEDFTVLVLLNILVGALLTIGGVLFLENLTDAFGASALVETYCKNYLSTYIIFIIPALLFSNLLMYVIATGGSKMAMFASLFGGIFNIIFDYVFIEICHFGMMGAALASGLGLFIPCIILAAYFMQGKRMLHFVKPKIRFDIIGKTITNGVSEFATSLISGIVMFLFNFQMLKYAGEEGVAASTVIFYIFGLMSAVYMGYMMGTSPLFSFFFGEQNREKLKKLKKISLVLISLIGLFATCFSVLGSNLLVRIFIEPNDIAYTIAVSGNKLFSFALLITGFNTFASALFTALGNGLISAVLAISRTFLFFAGSILLLPIFFGLNGLWLSVPVAEGLALALSVIFLKKYQSKYGY